MSYLVIDHISKSYGAIQAVKDFSLEINRGELVALVGPDGAGKTSLIRAMCHLVDADAGKVYLDGKDVFADFEPVKTMLGYMPQSFSLYLDLSVEENLRFYAGIFGVTGAAFRERRDYLYGFSALGPFADRRAGALSGGMKQKLALSCALVHDPQLLVLDEPTTGVDPLSRRQFWEILLRLKDSGSTILVSTPYMDEVLRADRAAFMLEGKKLSEGAPDELARQYSGQIFYLDRTPDSRLLAALHAIADLSARRFGAGMHLSIGPERRIEEFAGPLRAAGVETSDLHRIEPSLEDRFIQLMETPA